MFISKQNEENNWLVLQNAILLNWNFVIGYHYIHTVFETFVDISCNARLWQGTETDMFWFCQNTANKAFIADEQIRLYLLGSSR